MALLFLHSLLLARSIHQEFYTQRKDERYPSAKTDSDNATFLQNTRRRLEKPTSQTELKCFVEISGELVDESVHQRH